MTRAHPSACPATDSRLGTVSAASVQRQDVSDRIQIISDRELASVTATVETLPARPAAARADIAGAARDGDAVIQDDRQPDFPGLVLDDFSRAIMAKIVRKCGDREYWDRWAATNPAAKQDLIRQLYDNFFGVAFKGTRDKPGIVYTPVEIVDFIIRSVNDVLVDEFGQTLGSKGVHIIDPFTGTGTFITRLLQSGLRPYLDHGQSGIRQ